MRFTIPSAALATVVAGFLFQGFNLLADNGSVHSFYGSSDYSEAALMGIFYDLKQDQKHHPIPGDHYIAEFDKFVDSNWDEADLSRFFRVTRPLYATEIYMPIIHAEEAPSAFGVGKIVMPSYWFVHYKAQVSPPEDGVYRFRGVADDVMAVAVNDKTELVAFYGGWPVKTHWKETSGKGYSSSVGYVPCGDWFACKKSDVIDLDILIGEYPGGFSGAWLLIEKQGVKYPTFQDPQIGAQPVYPIFQLSPHHFERDIKRMPLPFSFDGGYWKAHQ